MWKLRISPKGYYWAIEWATGFADIPSSQGYKTVWVGPYPTIAALKLAVMAR